MGSEPYKNTCAYGLLKHFEAYRHKIEQYASIAHFSPIPVFVTAHDGLTILYVNPAYIKLTGCPVDNLHNFNWANVIHPDDRERSIAVWKKFVVDRKPVVICEKYVNVITGKVYPCHCSVYSVEGNGFVGFILPEGWNPDVVFEMLALPAGVPPA